MYSYITTILTLTHILCRPQRCFQLLPYAGGVLLLILTVFAVWVRSVPPAPVLEKKPLTSTTTSTTPQFDLDVLKSLDPETLAKAGLTLEDLEKMTTTVTTEDLQQQQQQESLLSEGDEEISLDEPEVGKEGKTTAVGEDRAAAAGEASPEESLAQQEGMPRKDDEL